MSKKELQRKAIVWVTCPDCGEEHIEGSFTHELTCTATTGRANASPILNPPVSDVEPGTGEEVTYTCHLCRASVTQDAADDILIDEKGNPVCSKTCKTVLDRKSKPAVAKPTRRKAQTPLDVAIAEWIKLDIEEEIHKAYYRRRGALTARILELGGVGTHWTDKAGTVYELAPCTGKYVHFNPYEIKRTRRDGEKAGSLTLERAEELGYQVLRKRAKSKKKELVSA